MPREPTMLLLLLKGGIPPVPYKNRENGKSGEQPAVPSQSLGEIRSIRSISALPGLCGASQLASVNLSDSSAHGSGIWQLPSGPSSCPLVLGLPFACPFFPGIRISFQKTSKTPGRNSWFLKRTMGGKNGELEERVNES